MSVDVTSVPPWKRELLDRKRRQEEESHRRGEDDQKRSLPSWKREILDKKNNQKNSLVFLSRPSESTTSHGHSSVCEYGDVSLNNSRLTDTEFSNTQTDHILNGPISVGINHTDQDSTIPPAFSSEYDPCPVDHDHIAKQNGIGHEHLIPIQKNPWLKSDIEKRYSGYASGDVGPSSPQANNSFLKTESDVHPHGLNQNREDDDVFIKEEVTYGRGFVHKLLRKFKHLSTNEDKSQVITSPKAYPTSPKRTQSSDSILDEKKPGNMSPGTLFDSEPVVGYQIDLGIKGKSQSMDNLMESDFHMPPKSNLSVSVENVCDVPSNDECDSENHSLSFSNQTETNLVRSGSIENLIEDELPKRNIVSLTRSVFESISTHGIGEVPTMKSRKPPESPKSTSTQYSSVTHSTPHKAYSGNENTVKQYSSSSESFQRSSSPSRASVADISQNAPSATPEAMLKTSPTSELPPSTLTVLPPGTLGLKSAQKSNQISSSSDINANHALYQRGENITRLESSSMSGQGHGSATSPKVHVSSGNSTKTNLASSDNDQLYPGTRSSSSSYSPSSSTSYVKPVAPSRRNRKNSPPSPNSLTSPATKLTSISNTSDGLKASPLRNNFVEAKNKQNSATSPTSGSSNIYKNSHVGNSNKTDNTTSKPESIKVNGTVVLQGEQQRNPEANRLNLNLNLNDLNLKKSALDNTIPSSSNKSNALSKSVAATTIQNTDLNRNLPKPDTTDTEFPVPLRRKTKRPAPSGPGSMLMRPASNLVQPNIKAEYLNLTDYVNVKKGDFAPAKKRATLHSGSDEDIPITNIDDYFSEDIPVTNIDDLSPSPREGDATFLNGPRTRYDFEGAGIIADRSLLIKTRRQKLKITFNDSATSTFEYPSEQSLLESLPAQPGDFDFPGGHGSLVNGLHDEAAEMPDLNEPASLKSTPGVGAGGSLGSYKARTGVDYYFGMQKSEEDQVPKASPVSKKPEQPEDMQVKPADDEFNWSEGTTSDLLF